MMRDVTRALRLHFTVVVLPLPSRAHLLPSAALLVVEHVAW